MAEQVIFGIEKSEGPEFSGSSALLLPWNYLK